MSLDGAVGWFFIATWVLVLALIVLVALPRIARAGLTLVRHVLDISKVAALQSEIARAERNAVRITRALDRFPALAVRADAAVTTIRTATVLPPRLTRFAVRLRDEYRAFRRSLG